MPGTSSGGCTRPGSRRQRLTTVGDQAPLIREVLEEGLSRSRFIIITGGLGLTEDDVTVPAAALALDRRLVIHEGLLDRIRRCLRERQIPWAERYASLALIPEGAQLLDPGGMACGFALNHRGVRLFFLPGVPQEMRHLFDGIVLPGLVAWAGPGEARARAPYASSGFPRASCRG